jgi:hypothetical protein
MEAQANGSRHDELDPSAICDRENSRRQDTEAGGRYAGATAALCGPAGPSGVEVLGAKLAALGILLEPNESSAEATARALRMTVGELREELRLA